MLTHNVEKFAYLTREHAGRAVVKTQQGVRG